MRFGGRANPARSSTGLASGELYIVDGASLPKLPAKAHTLPIMANADRIARAIPAEWAPSEWR